MNLRIDDLGYYQFERLAQVILKSVYSATAESWGGTKDQGIDALIPATAEKTSYLGLPAPVVAQAKFVENANAAGSIPLPALKRAVQVEIDKIRRQLGDGSWKEVKSYLLITNVELTAGQRSAVIDLLENALPDLVFRIIAGKDVEDYLIQHPDLKRAFPQLLGLADLKELLQSFLHGPLIAESSAFLDEAIESMNTFVGTRAYSESLAALDKFHAVAITGPPEMGKTAMAKAIGVVRLCDSWDVYYCRRSEDFWSLHNNDSKQLFIIDDAFGSVKYNPQFASEWADHVDRIANRLDDSHQLVWTSRTYQFHKMLEVMKHDPHRKYLNDEYDIFVNAADLTESERIWILYTHAKAAQLSDDCKSFVREHAQRIVRHRSYTPLRVAHFVRKLKIEGIPPDGDKFIERCIAEYNEHLIQSMNQLEDEHIAYLCAIQTNSDINPYLVRFIGRTPQKASEAIRSDLIEYFLKEAT